MSSPGFIVYIMARLTCWFGVNRSLFGYPPLVHAAAQGYAGACGVLLHRGANVRASTKKGLVRATEVASDKCHDWPEVRRVIEPYVKVRHIHYTHTRIYIYIYIERERFHGDSRDSRCMGKGAHLWATHTSAPPHTTHSY